jgi:hypothetical protein
LRSAAWSFITTQALEAGVQAPPSVTLAQIYFVATATALRFGSDHAIRAGALLLKQGACFGPQAYIRDAKTCQRPAIAENIA